MYSAIFSQLIYIQYNDVRRKWNTYETTAWKVAWATTNNLLLLMFSSPSECMDEL